jgi:hypothetical protein
MLRRSDWPRPDDGFDKCAVHQCDYKQGRARGPVLDMLAADKVGGQINRMRQLVKSSSVVRAGARQVGGGGGCDRLLDTKMRLECGLTEECRRWAQ